MAQPPWITWLVLSPGPAVCGHVAVACGDRLFVHGGKSSSDPSIKDVRNDLWIFNLKVNAWETFTSPQSPYLSQHCAGLSFDGSRIFFIGGWTGHHRAFDVYSLNLSTLVWCSHSTTGFPTGGGLSSFTATQLISKTPGEDLFLICGREGSLRMQRRHGNAYRLLCRPSGECRYEPHPHAMASRSGHTACGMSKTKEIVIIGGRDDKLVERVSGLKSRPKQGDSVFPNSFIERLSTVRPMIKSPKARQRHVAVVIGDAILIHGGETFDGRFIKASKDVFAFVPGSRTSEGKGDEAQASKWFAIESYDAPNLASHAADVVEGSIVVCGGFTSGPALGMKTVLDSASDLFGKGLLESGLTLDGHHAPLTGLSISSLFEEFAIKKEPVKISAPMVRYSKLAFRKLVRKYGVDLCFTPMIVADAFVKSVRARDSDFSTDPAEDRPLIVQFAARDDAEFADAAAIVRPFSDGVDLNCGCPQRWAIQDGLGCCLLKKPQLVHEMVRAVRRRVSDLDFNVSIKIRISDNLAETVELCRRAEAAGVGLITVHGRTPAERHQPVHLDKIKDIARSVGVPCVANGDIRTSSDVVSTFTRTGCQGVMAATGLLKNPAMFAGYDMTPKECIADWINVALDVGTPFSCFHHHLVDMTEKIMSKSDRILFNSLTSTSAVIEFFREKYYFE